MSFTKKILNKEFINSINNSFSNWANFSKQKKFDEMFALVSPNSGFYELTDNCQKRNGSGMHYYYQFEEIEIEDLKDENNIAIVKGVIKLIFSANGQGFSGTFLAGSVFNTKKMTWLLADIEIEWE